MALAIETFSNQRGSNAFFKAAGHPAVVEKARALLARLEAGGPVAIYDPFGTGTSFAALWPLDGVTIAGTYVQDVTRVGAPLLGQKAQPVTELPASGAKTVLVAGFDAERALAHVRHLLPKGAEAITLDAMRLPEDAITEKRRYLDPLNFATNFAFFREEDGYHTRVVSANYWSGYGAKAITLWCFLFDAQGRTLAEWRQAQPGGASSLVLDSQEIRARFKLGPFTGQLFIHAIGVAGHDVVKYALDTYGDDEAALSCTHDANAWPSDLYAGLPAPRADEWVILWLQNCHPCAIPARGVGLNPMGEEPVAWIEEPLPAFASRAVDVASLLPNLSWPRQIEIQAGRHIVRPRYEVHRKGGRLRIAHPNVERTDLSVDPKLAELGNLMGKGHILPVAVLPIDRYETVALPTPMSTAQHNLPIAVTLYDPEGQELGRRSLGRLPRDHACAVDVGALANGHKGYAHIEFCYDFSEGGEADGWLHALVRYEDRASRHVAETSFGAHIFNTVMTYKGEPQSYAGPPPGLSTRLFLRLGPAPLDTLCHLIYPASTPWHGASDTKLVLCRADGSEVAMRPLAIPCGGSRLWRHHETFTESERKSAGEASYVLIRDTTCRLFGYHGLLGAKGAFSLDHMFGF